MQDDIDGIWRQISIIDSIGRAKLIRECGGDALVDFVTGARNVAKLLTSMRRSLRSASGHLECDRLYPIYSQTVHEDLCMNTALASSYGFILFLILAITTSVMITLRASWLQSIGDEEKVFEDEDDIAENMVVDEHEEYLAYISHYKHEWQEYNGIDNGVASPRSSRDMRYEYHGSSPRYFPEYDDDAYYESGAEEEFRTDGEGYQGSDECSEVSAPFDEETMEHRVEPLAYKSPTAAPATMPLSIDDVLYPSLDGKSYEESEILDVPQPMPPPPANPEYKGRPSAPLSVHARNHRGQREPEGQHAKEENSPEQGSEATKEGQILSLHNSLASPESSVSMDLWY